HELAQLAGLVARVRGRAPDAMGHGEQRDRGRDARSQPARSVQRPEGEGPAPAGGGGQVETPRYQEALLPGQGLDARRTRGGRHRQPSFPAAARQPPVAMLVLNDFATSMPPERSCANCAIRARLPPAPSRTSQRSELWRVLSVTTTDREAPPCTISSPPDALSDEVPCPIADVQRDTQLSYT